MRQDDVVEAIALLGRVIRDESTETIGENGCRLAEEFGFGSLLYYRSRGRLPEPYAARMGMSYRLGAQRMLGAMFMLDTACRIFDQAGLRYLPIKGAALQRMGVYAEPALRTMCDLDFWMHPDDCMQASHLLETNGWQKRDEISNEHHITGLVKNNVCIELHFDLPGLEELSSDWFDRLPRGGDGRVTASPEMHLLILFYHAVEHEWSNLSRVLTDAGMMLKSIGINFDVLDKVAAGCGVASPRLLFEAFPELIDGAAPRLDSLSSEADLLRNTAIEFYSKFDPGAKPVPLEFRPLRFNWWRQRLYRCFSPTWVRCKYDVKSGDTYELWKAYLRDWSGKIARISQMIWRDRESMRSLEWREKLLQTLYPGKRPERKY